MIEQYVALLDVLGFRSLVYGRNSESRLEQYRDGLNNVSRTLQETENSVSFIVFSDSIILRSDGDSPTDLRKILVATSMLFAKMLEINIPLRGAIAHGVVFTTESQEGTNNRTFVAGAPIIEAYEVEQKQDWVGVMLASSVLEHAQREVTRDICNNFGKSYKELDSNRPWSFVLKSWPSIPIKTATGRGDFEGYAVIPCSCYEQYDDVLRSLKMSVSSLRRLKLQAPNPAAQYKYTKALELIEGVFNEWHRQRIATIGSALPP